MSKRKNLKATVASLLAATLLTGNIGAIQPRWENTITESIVNERILTAKAAESQKGKVNVKLASKKKKAKNKKAHIAYEKQIVKAKKEILSLWTECSVYFVYTDVDGDGIDECIVLGEWTDGKTKNKKKIDLCSNMMSVYTYYNGKVKNVLYAFCGGNGITGYVNKKKKCLYAYCHTSSDEYSFEKIKIKNGKGKSVAVYESEPVRIEDGYPVCKYIANGKKVSKKKFQKIQNSALNTGKITMYKATKKNMKKLR